MRRFVCAVMMGILLIPIFVHAQNLPLEQALDDGGRIRPGVENGSFDARGYRMQLAPDGSPSFSKAVEDSFWDDRFGTWGVDNIIYAVAIDSLGNLIIAGDFIAVNNMIMNHIAIWNGSTWLPLSSGINGPVYALAVSDSNVYAGGEFTTAGGVSTNRIAKWNGTSWSALGTGMNGKVRALAVNGGDLYAGGEFTTTGGVSANRIAKWDGSSWSALGTGMNGTVYALAVTGSNVYAGGLFTTAGGVSANYIAKWNGTSWSALGTGMNNIVYALAVSGSNLYVGGWFTTAGGVSANYIAKWDGTNWSALGSGTNSIVYAFAVSDSNLYVGGWFTTAGGVSANYIAKWDGTSWSTMNSAMNRQVYALAVSGSNVYAGGSFSTPDGGPANYISKWDGSGWSTVGQSEEGLYVNGNITALAASGSNVYAGGGFSWAGGVYVTRMAKWDGKSWSALGAGINGTANAIAVSGSSLYAGGEFTIAGSVTANRIAKWDGTSWAALGSGMNSYVYTLAVSDSNLYVGGWFTTAGGVSANYIAKWNGTSWSALGTGMNGKVRALAVNGGDLYAGGEFTTAGGVSANRIAKWDGSSWSALGTGMNGTVYALAISGNNIYAGGDFTTAGVASTNRIAKWDGSSWSAIGTGMNGTVNALAVSGNNIYVGGTFTTAGEVGANRIAKWNGSSWSALGSGTNNTIIALAVTDSAVYVGGSFTTAGGRYSYRYGIYGRQQDLMPPVITYSMPDSGAAVIDVNTPVAIVFSKQMDVTNFTFTVMPNPGGVIGTWNTGSDTLHIAHNAFAYATAETIRVTHAEDTLGNLLLGRSVITFTTLSNQGPVITMKIQPSSPQPEPGPYLVQAVITDPAKKGGKSIIADSLYYRFGNGVWLGLGTTGVVGDTFSFHIPAIDTVTVDYCLKVWDNMGLSTMEPSFGYYSFSVDTLPPLIASSTPDSGAVNVATNSLIEIVFSKQIDTTSFTFTVIPNLGGINHSWNPGRDTLHISHNPFSSATPETVNVIHAADISGNLLAGRSVITFTTKANIGPVITIKTQPSSPQTEPGPYLVQAVIIDPAKGGKSIAADSLYYRVRNGVWLGLGTTGVVGDTFSFQLPAIDTGKIDYCIKAWDNLGLSTLEPSLGLYIFYVDTLHPRITYSAPDSGAINAALGSPIRLVFSEPMDTTSFAFNMSPDSGGVFGVWNSRHDTLDIAHSAFTYATAETIRVTHAEDTLGNMLSGRSVIIFNTLANQGPVITMTTQPSSPQTAPGPYLVQAVISDPAKGGKSMAADTLFYRVSSGTWSSLGSSAPNGDTCSFQIPAIDTGSIDYCIKAWDNAGLSTLAPSLGLFTLYVDTLHPKIKYSTPDSGATNVSRNAPIVVAFSEPMDTTSFTFTVLPDPGGVSGIWNAKRDTLHIVHSDFAYAAAESVSITNGTDPFGNPLSGRSKIIFITIPNGVNGRPETQTYLLQLNQASPNPVTGGRTVIRFSLPERTEVKLEVYNVLGQKVNTLVDGRLEKGYHTVNWNGIDHNGQKLSSGVYVYQLKAMGKILTKQLTVIR